jgi:hypothetical protein
MFLAPPAQFRVPDIAQRITKEIEAQERQTDSQTRKDGEPRSLLYKSLSSPAEHQPPGRIWWLWYCMNTGRGRRSVATQAFIRERRH